MSASSTVAPGRLASAFQEFLTATVRLRADRQPVTDANTFRAQITGLLGRAEEEALRLGFSAADARLAVFAVVAFLDESVLNVRNPALAEWARRPLQDELFGAHMGGEWFFQHVDLLLGRPDSEDLADLLEVHQLCLLLGFHGKFGASDSGQLYAITSRVAERLARLRGHPGDLAPEWMPPTDRVDTTDPWLKRLSMGAIGSAVLVAVLWGAYTWQLSSNIKSIGALAPQTASTPVR